MSHTLNTRAVDKLIKCWSFSLQQMSTIVNKWPISLPTNEKWNHIKKFNCKTTFINPILLKRPIKVLYSRFVLEHLIVNSPWIQFSICHPAQDQHVFCVHQLTDIWHTCVFLLCIHCINKTIPGLHIFENYLYEYLLVFVRCTLSLNVTKSIRLTVWLYLPVICKY